MLQFYIRKSEIVVYTISILFCIGHLFRYIGLYDGNGTYFFVLDQLIDFTVILLSFDWLGQAEVFLSSNRDW